MGGGCTDTVYNDDVMCRGMMMIGFMIKRFRPIWFQGILDQEATSFNFDSRMPIKQSLCSYRAVLKTILGAWIVVSLLFSLRAKWVFDFLQKQSRMHSIATIRPNNNNNNNDNNNKFTLSEWTLTMAYLWKSSVTGHLAIFEIWDKEIMNFHLSFKNLLRFDSRLMKRNGKSKALCCGDANAGPQPGGGRGAARDAPPQI